MTVHIGIERGCRAMGHSRLAPSARLQLARGAVWANVDTFLGAALIYSMAPMYARGGAALAETSVAFSVARRMR